MVTMAEVAVEIIPVDTRLIRGGEVQHHEPTTLTLRSQPQPQLHRQVQVQVQVQAQAQI